MEIVMKISQDYQIKNQTLNSPRRSQKEITVENKKNTDVSISKNGTKKTMEYEISKKYNLRSISESDVLKLSKDLKDAGLISSDEFAVMSFPRRKASFNYGGSINPEDKFNFLQDSKNRYDFSASINPNSNETKMLKSIVDTLSRLYKIS